MIEMVFFDAGDTLLRPHPSFAELFALVCRDAGEEVTPQDVNDVQQRLAPHLVDLAEEAEEESLTYGGSSLDAEQSRAFWTHLYVRILKELGITQPGLANELFAVFSNSSSYKLFDDVLPALDRIQKAGFRMGLISNFERWLEKMLVELEVGHHFDPAVISGVEGVEKPDPKIYEIALERAGVPPERAIHIGDSPGMDCEPASAVGLNCILLDRLHRYPDSQFLRVTSLEELPPLLPNL